MSSIFDDLDEITNAPRSERRYFDAAGRARVQLTKWVFQRSARDKTKRQVIAAFKVITADNGYEPGDEISYVKTYGANERTNEEIKGLAAAVLGVPFVEAKGALIEASFRDEGRQVLGTVLDITVRANTAQNGNTYYNPHFKHVEPPQPDDTDIPF